IVGYVGGVRVVNTNLLLGISVSSSSSGPTVLVRKYSMGYGGASTTTRARLTSVQECAGSAGTDCLAPTIMSYQDGQIGISPTANTAVSNAPQNYVDSKYDFNGDGYIDVLYYNGTTWMVAFGSATGYGTPVNTGAAGNGLPGDVPGTGMDGILAVSGSNWHYYTWNGTAFVHVSTGLAADAAVGLADINGDGLPDLVYFSTVYGASGHISVSSRLNTSSAGAVHFSTTLNSAWSYSGSLGSATLYHPDLPYMGPLKTWDFNGDRREDLALVYKDTSVAPAIWNYVVLLGNGTGFATGQIGASSTSIPPSFKFLNWNNDACADVQYGNSILISGCGGSQGSTITMPSATYLTVADWNGDGRTDVLVANGSTIGVYLSTSTGYSSLISTSIPYSSTCAYYTFDADGDGLDDLMCWDQLGTSMVKYYLHYGAAHPADLLTTITDGFGMAQSPTYVSIAQNNFTKSSDGAYPEKDVISALYVVSQFSASDGTGTAYTNTLWYYGAHSNLQGLGSDGFQSMRTRDSRNGTYRYQYFERTFPLRGMV
ncbi:MAG: FG-GAP-like repeat-containing protein, partial [bacterium]